MAGDAADLITIDALGPEGAYRTRNREPVTTTAGDAVAELSIAPPLYVSRAISAQRNVRPLPTHEREAALAKAADIFATGVIAGLDFDGLCRCGQPDFRRADLGDPRRGPQRRRRSRRRRSTRWARHGRRVRCRTGATSAPAAAPRCGHGGAKCSRCSPPATAPVCTGCGRRRSRWDTGSRSARHAVSHSPRTAWYMRCGRPVFDPRTPYTCPPIIAAPTRWSASADLAMVYGGQDVVDKYADDPTVFVNGPGRAKILITADRDWRDYLDVITDSIANLGGVACVNTTAVLYEGDPAPLAEAIAQRLSTIAALPADDEDAVLPTQNIDAATALASHLAATASGHHTACSARIRSWPHWATTAPRCARPCICWPGPTSPSSTSSCRSRASGFRRGRAPTGLRRCGIRW